jgi:hypothetical protein
VSWDQVLYAPAVLCIQWPLAALLPAAVLGGAFLIRRHPLIGVAAGLWAAYAVYESLMKARILCSGECNIRIDLLLIMPLLYLASLVAVALFFRGKAPHGAA